jgi:hypothetical protein
VAQRGYSIEMSSVGEPKMIRASNVCILGQKIPGTACYPNDDQNPECAITDIAEVTKLGLVDLICDCPCEESGTS